MRNFLKFYNFPDLLMSLIIGIYPLIGLSIWGWSGEGLVLYFILETFIFSAFTVIKLLINKRIKVEVEKGALESNTDLTQYKPEKFYLLTNITTAFMHVLFQFFFLGGILFIFINPVIFKGGLSLERIFSDSTQIYSLLALYSIDFIFNYIFLKGYLKDSPAKVNGMALVRSVILFLSMWLTLAVFFIFSSPLILAYMLVIVRILFTLITSSFGAFRKFLQFKYPDLKVTSSWD